MTVVDYRELDPFEKDHALFVCKRKDDKPISYENIKKVEIQKSFEKKKSFNKKRRR